MSPGVRYRLWSCLHEAARREPPNTTRRTSFKALAGLASYGASMQSIEAALDKHHARGRGVSTHSI